MDAPTFAERTRCKAGNRAGNPTAPRRGKEPSDHPCNSNVQKATPNEVRTCHALAKLRRVGKAPRPLPGQPPVSLGPSPCNTPFAQPAQIDFGTLLRHKSLSSTPHALRCVHRQLRPFNHNMEDKS